MSVYTPTKHVCSGIEWKKLEQSNHLYAATILSLKGSLKLALFTVFPYFNYQRGIHAITTTWTF